MWLPPKVRHLVLINQSPLPSSFPPLLLFPQPLSFLPIYFPIFGEKPACSWDNPKLKTNSQLPSEPRNQRHFFKLCLRWEREKKKKTCGLSLWKNAYLNCGRIRAQSIARAGGLGAPESGERMILLAKSVESGNGRRELHLLLLLLLSIQLSGSFSPPQPPASRQSFTSLPWSSEM